MMMMIIIIIIIIFYLLHLTFFPNTFLLIRLSDLHFEGNSYFFSSVLCALRVTFSLFHFYAFSQNYEKRLLAASCLYVCQLAWLLLCGLMKSDIWEFFEYLSRKFQFHSNISWIARTTHADQYTLISISFSLILKMSRKICIRNQNTHFLFSDLFPEDVLFVR